MSARLKCENCEWIGTLEQMLMAAHPFAPDQCVYGCPDCKTIGDFVQLCDEPGCVRDATCGTPIPGGYRQTCGRHMPKATPNAKAGTE